ncbi:MAG: chaperonin GroES [Flavobacteriaceae bacterium]|jgi:chaperonin GroES
MSKNISITPLGDRVLVKPQTVDTVTASGIILPASTQEEKKEQGEVIAVGPGKMKDDGTTIPVNVSVGDTVLFAKYGPDEIEVEGEKYLIVREDNILAILK